MNDDIMTLVLIHSNFWHVCAMNFKRVSQNLALGEGTATLTLTHGSWRPCIMHYAVQGVVKKDEPIKNRYISKSKYRWNMIVISFESELLKFFDSVPLFIIRYKLRPWKVLTCHARNRWCKQVDKILISSFSVMN